MHDDAQTGEVGEAEGTGAVDEHVGAAAYGGGEAEGDAEHQRHDEGQGIAAQQLGLMIDDGEEDGAGAYVADELADQRGQQAHDGHHKVGVAITELQHLLGNDIGNARLGDGNGEDDGGTEDEQQLPLDVLGDVGDATAAQYHHDAGCQHGGGHEGQHVERRDDEHEHEDDGRGDGLLA